MIIPGSGDSSFGPADVIGGKWFLPPVGWTLGNRGAALLAPDTDDLRVEFVPGR
jgi:hypothetical protein